MSILTLGRGWILLIGFMDRLFIMSAFDLIQNYPSQIIAIIVGVIFMVISSIGTICFHIFIRKRFNISISFNELIGITLDGFLALYGILLGLLAVGAYENLNSMNDIVSKEASNISVIYRDFSGYPEPIRGELEEQLHNYAHEIVHRSWPEQARHIIPTGEAKYIDKLFDILVSFKPKDKGEEILHAQTLDQFNKLMESRRGRIDSLDSKIPDILWWLVIMGAAITMLLICLLNYELVPHILFGAILSFYVGAMIAVIASMDSPFVGANSIDPQSIQKVIDSPSFNK